MIVSKIWHKEQQYMGNGHTKYEQETRARKEVRKIPMSELQCPERTMDKVKQSSFTRRVVSNKRKAFLGLGSTHIINGLTDFWEQKSHCSDTDAIKTPHRCGYVLFFIRDALCMLGGNLSDSSVSSSSSSHLSMPSALLPFLHRMRCTRPVPLVHFTADV